MGRLVADGELLPLNSYNKKYGWEKETGLSPVQLNSFNAKGSELGVGNYSTASQRLERSLVFSITRRSSRQLERNLQRLGQRW